MIGFLSPLWLLAGLAAAVPLVIHLLRRRTGAPVDFPAVRWLERAEREHSRSLKLRNLVLMLLRVFALLFLAIAAARPVARIGGAGHAPTAMAIVLDNSLSTSAVVGGRPVLDELKARASEVAARASGGDRLWLITADGAVQGGSATVVRAAIARAAPLAGSGDLEGAVRIAAALSVAAPVEAHEVAVVTDAQATSWPRPLALGDVRTLVYRPLGAPPADHAVVLAVAEPGRWTPRGAVHLRVRSTDSVSYRITLGARTLARGLAGPDGDAVVHAAPAERGWVAGSVELEPDELRGDDVRYFAVWLGAAPEVRVDTSAGIFARDAVAALVRAGRAAAGDGITVASADAPARLPALLTAPADPVRIGAANRALERLGVPWRFGAARRGSAPVTTIPRVSVSLRYLLLPVNGAPPAETLAVVAGEPWVVRGDGYVLVASPLVPEATDLPLHAAFLPWLSEMITQQLSAAGNAAELRPRGRIARPAGVDAIEGTGGARLPASGDSIEAPSAAGIWWMLRAGTRAGAIVVNAEPEESDLARLDSAALASRLAAKGVLVTENGATFARGAYASGSRRPVGSWFAALALALLLAEGAAAASRRPEAG